MVFHLAFDKFWKASNGSNSNDFYTFEMEFEYFETKTILF